MRFAREVAAARKVSGALGAVLGSPGYMSPEQAQGHRVGPASDVFSLGALLACAAAGAGPFGDGSAAALVYRVVSAEPDLDAVPAGFHPLIGRCLAKVPGERPGLGDLLAELGGEPVPGDWLPAEVTSTFPDTRQLPGSPRCQRPNSRPCPGRQAPKSGPPKRRHLASTPASLAPTPASRPTTTPTVSVSSIPGVTDDPDEITASKVSDSDSGFCTTWLDNDGSRALSGTLNTSFFASCDAELYRSGGPAVSLSASWGAERTSALSDTGHTMWICVWVSSDPASEQCSSPFAVNGDTPTQT